jgi:hypothetical protein
MSDKFDQSCSTPKLVDDIALLMLKDVHAGRKRIDDCDLTLAANQAMSRMKAGDTMEELVGRAHLFRATAHRDLTEQVEAKANEIYQERIWFQGILDHLHDQKK